MATLKEVVAIVGKYTDRDGKEKNQYQNMGKIIETKSGSQMIKIDCIPVGWDGWAYLNDPKPRDGQQQSAPSAPRQQEPQPSLMSDDDIPF